MRSPDTMTLPQMRRQQARQLRQIEGYAQGGEGKINRERLQKAIDRYLNSRTVRALAIAEAERVGVEEIAARANALRAEMDVSLPWDEALANCCKNIRWNYRPKSTPGVRQVCSLRTHLKAWNKIAKRLIEAIHSTKLHIADWRGRGRDWQIKRITDVLTRPGLSVVIADVTDAFASVQPDALYQFLNLPDALIRGALDARSFTFSQNVEKSRDEVFSKYPLLRLPNSGMPPQGLMQGSPTSNAIFGVLFDDLPDQIPENLGCFAYCDNIVVVTEGGQSAQSVSESLAEYFTRHPAGSFSLKSEIECLNTLGFDHLGYWFRWSHDRLRVALSAKNTNLFYRSLEEPRENGLNGMDYVRSCFAACSQEAVDFYEMEASELAPIMSHSRSDQQLPKHP
ncbi:MAG: reverse transcriptase domain-containing protein [Erythrobacter sp.]